MALIDAFFTQSAEVKPFERQGDGEPIFGAVETRPCRIEMGAHLTTVHDRKDGQIDQVEARALMFCNGPKIPTDSIVTYDGEDYRVVRCEEMVGFGFSHCEVYLM